MGLAGVLSASCVSCRHAHTGFRSPTRNDISGYFALYPWQIHCKMEAVILSEKSCCASYLGRDDREFCLGFVGPRIGNLEDHLHLARTEIWAIIRERFVTLGRFWIKNRERRFFVNFKTYSIFI